MPRKFSLQFVKSLNGPQLFLSEYEANHRANTEKILYNGKSQLSASTMSKVSDTKYKR